MYYNSLIRIKFTNWYIRIDLIELKLPIDMLEKVVSTDSVYQ